MLKNAGLGAAGEYQEQHSLFHHQGTAKTRACHFVLRSEKRR
jgi:hypothetical protein